MRFRYAAAAAVLALVAPTVPSAAVVEPMPGPRVVEYRDARPCEVGRILVKVRAPKRYRGRLVRDPVMETRVYAYGRRIQRKRAEKRTANVFVKKCPIPAELRGATLKVVFRWGARGLPWSEPTRVGLAF
ncbi:MAG: hypothetical protein Q8P38_11920 [Candidatus Nanopelagicales bacterium]|nr:hypothetical protein [Candidatus Nanopelagicales bacterium]